MIPRDEPHRRLLVRCGVVNRASEQSVRYVEHEHFRLWQYMMADKHGLIVSNPTVCLWIPDVEFAANASVFERAGQCEAVMRLTFAIYDPTSGMCNTTQRFIPVAEVEHVRGLLLAHVPVEVRESADFVMEQQRGYAIARVERDATRSGTPLEF